jgi:hypothetical protein
LWLQHHVACGDPDPGEEIEDLVQIQMNPDQNMAHDSDAAEEVHLTRLSDSNQIEPLAEVQPVAGVRSVVHQIAIRRHLTWYHRPWVELGHDLPQ